MGAEFYRKYGDGSTGNVRVPIVKRAVVDYAVGADWTPAAGDVKVSIDGGAAANIGTLPTAVAMGNTAYWDFVFSGLELQGKKITVTVADAATKVIEDQGFDIITWGHPSAGEPWDRCPQQSPYPAEITASSFNSDATSHTVSMPASVEQGDLLVCFFSNDGSATVTTPSGWTQLHTTVDGGNAVRLSTYAKKADGTEGGTTVDFVTSATERAAAQVHRFKRGTWYGDSSNSFAQSIKIGTAATGTSTTPDPPTVSPPWGKLNALVIAVEANDDGTVTDSAYPSNYYDRTNTVSDANAAGVSLTTAIRSQMTTSENPGTFTITSQEWVAQTVAIRPAQPAAIVDAARLGPWTDHGGAAAVLTIERLIAISTTAGEPGIKATGNTTAAGILATGGASGPGGRFVAGATSGAGLTLVASGNSAGFSITGSGTGAGIQSSGGGSGGDGILTSTISTTGTVTFNSFVPNFAANSITSSVLAADSIGSSQLATTGVNEIRDAITGGSYALSTDANGRIRIVDGTGAGEIDTNAGAIALVNLVTDITTKTGFRLSATGVDDIWDEDIVAAHGTADTAGLIVSQLTKRSVTFSTAAVQGSILRQLADDGTATFDRTTDSLQAIRDGASAPSAASIADAVWEEQIADHSGTSGSTAEALNAAGSAGDPWVTALPGAYGAGSAGFILGTNLNATISSRSTLTQAQVTGGSYALDTDANGRIRIVDGTGTGELDTNAGKVLLASTQTFNNTGTWTGNITGNLSGSVGSVTGAVGSVTGNVGGNVTGSVGSIAAGGLTAASTDATYLAELEHQISRIIYGVPAGSSVWFVDGASGNDSNDGRQATPFATVTKAISVHGANDAIALSGSITNNSAAGQLLAGARICSAFGRPMAVVTSSFSTSGGKWLKPADRCVIENFKLVCTETANIVFPIGLGTGVDSAASDVVIRKMHIVGKSDAVYNDVANCFNWLVSDCRLEAAEDTVAFHGTAMTSIVEDCDIFVTGPASRTGTQDTRGFYATLGTHVVRRNRFRCTGAEGGDVGVVSGGATIYMYDNTSHVGLWDVWVQSGTVYDYGANRGSGTAGALIVTGTLTDRKGHAHPDWRDVLAPTTTQALTGTTIAATQQVASVTGDLLGKVLGGGAGTITGTGVRAVDSSGNAIAPASATTNIQGRLPAALVSGRMDASVGAMQADTLTAAAAAADFGAEIQALITGGSYPFSTDANGRVRIVDGTGTGELDTNAGAVTLTAAERNSIADALLDRADAIESGITTRLALRYMSAGLVGLLSGSQTATEVYKGIGQSAGGTTRLTVNADSSGNRSAITLA